jgi:hypothetical protein
MIIRFNKEILCDWQHPGENEWVRVIAGDNIPAISIVKSGLRQVWFPIFWNHLDYLNIFYNKNYKEFPSNKIEQAKVYVDNFLIRINNLKVFW